MAKIDAFFNLMFEQKASDLHLASGNNPMLRINGELQRVDHSPLENDDLKKMLYEIAPEYKIKTFEETCDVASRAGGGDGADRLWKIHDAGGNGGLREQEPARSYHHGGGPDRIR